MAFLFAMAAPGGGGGGSGSDPDGGSDMRGWIQCGLSATACVFGACIVYVDLFIRLLPGKKSFRIQDSRAFLSCSLSFSFGVMIFSSLFSMLPSSKAYLVQGGASDRAAGFLMMAGFALGFVGMQVVSRIIHRFMPSHVVDCDHSHGGEGDDGHPHIHPAYYHGHHGHYGHHGHGHTHALPPPTESTPLLLPPGLHNTDGPEPGPPSRTPSSVSVGSSAHAPPPPPPRVPPVGPLQRAVSMGEVRRRVLSFVRDTKADCDEFGPCYGFSDPCGQECKRKVVAAVAAHPAVSDVVDSDPAAYCAVTASTASSRGEGEVEEDEEEASSATVTGYGTATSGHGGHDGVESCDESEADTDLEAGRHSDPAGHGDPPAGHHHHVPANAFMSIGLQTVLAIGLHKFPEGFVAFATNHANPALGATVFVALFVHNIAEGFAMALPLYMALGSRARAVAWAAALGGLSQPLGAAAAALWLGTGGEGRGGRGGGDGNSSAYGMLFAGTAGLMAAVALQLFAEGLTLHHNRQLSIGFGFVGMLLLGLSNALGH